MKKLFILLALLVSSAQAQEMTHRYFQYSPMLFTPSTMSITGNTADGADSQQFTISAGGALAVDGSRGAYLSLKGNENASAADIQLMAGAASGSALALGTLSADSFIYLQTNGASRLTIPSLSDANDVDLLLGNATVDQTPVFTIRGQTTDAHDDGELILASSGAIGTARGARISVYGNEAAANANKGSLALVVGAGDGGSNKGDINMYAASGNLSWSFLDTGDLAQDAGNGGNIVFSKDKTGVIDSTEPTNAAGADLANATLIAANVTFVASVGAGEGVKLPVAPIAGKRFVIYNTENAVLKVYPGEATDNINAGADGAAVEVAQYAALYCHAASADQVYCGEWAVP